jgi:hypothetical protein
VELARDELEDRLEFRGTNEVPVCAEIAFELVHGIAFARLCGRLSEPVDDDRTDDFAEELFLVGEVEVDGAFGDAGATSDVVESSAGEASFTENVESGLEDLSGPLFGEAPPARS